MTLHSDPQTRLRRVIVEDFVMLPDVLPDKTYQTTIRPAEPLLLGEVLVRDFALEQLIIGVLNVATEERSTIAGSRTYSLKRRLLVRPAMDITILLRNTTDQPLRMRGASIEMESTR